MILLNPTRTPYLFDKDLAAHVVYAEVTHFAREMSHNGPSEDEVQTLTRRLAYLVDKDLKWTEIDQLVSWAKELATIGNGTHPNLDVNSAGTVDNTDHLRGALLIEMFWEIGSILGACRMRYEVAA